MGRVLGILGPARDREAHPLFGDPVLASATGLIGVLLTLDLWAKSARSIPLGISCGKLTQGWNVEHC